MSDEKTRMNTMNSPKKKKTIVQKRLKKKYRNGMIILLLMFMAVILYYGFFSSSVSTKKINENVSIVVNGEIIDIAAPSKIGLVEKRAILSDSLSNYDVTGIPIYFSNEDILVGNEWMYYDRHAYRFYRVKENTRINKEVDSINGSFMFDGNTTYLFLEDVDVFVNASSFHLPAYSYLYCVKQNFIELVNSKTKEYTYIDIKNSDLINVAFGNSSIDIKNDILTNSEGNRQILLSSFESLPVLPQ